MSTYGPYDKETDTWESPVFKEWRELTYQIPSGDPERRVQNMQTRHLVEACEQAGVELGDHDRSVLHWLANWEASTVQAFIGIIGRAHAAGRSAERS